MNQKDPHNTRERLTKALTIIATSNEDARRRAEYAWLEIMPLQEHEFPITAVQYYRFIRENSGVIINGSATNELCGKILKAVWDLYWEMTENIQYR